MSSAGVQQSSAVFSRLMGFNENNIPIPPPETSSETPPPAPAPAPAPPPSSSASSSSFNVSSPSISASSFSLHSFPSARSISLPPIPYRRKFPAVPPSRTLLSGIYQIVEEIQSGDIDKNDADKLYNRISQYFINLLAPDFDLEITLRDNLKDAIKEMVASDGYKKADGVALIPIILEYTTGVKGPIGNLLNISTSNKNDQRVINLLQSIQTEVIATGNHTRGGRRRLRSRRHRTNRRNTRRGNTRRGNTRRGRH